MSASVAPVRAGAPTDVNFFASVGSTAQLAILHEIPYCAGGHTACQMRCRVAPVAVLHGWPQCTGVRIARSTCGSTRVVALHRRPYCTDGHIAQTAISHRRPLCRLPDCAGGDGHIARLRAQGQHPLLRKKRRWDSRVKAPTPRSAGTNQSRTAAFGNAGTTAAGQAKKVLAPLRYCWHYRQCWH